MLISEKSVLLFFLSRQCFIFLCLCLPFVLKGLEGCEYPRDPFPLTAATRNWYQCPVFNRPRRFAWGFVDTWHTVQELSLDSRYLGPTKWRSSTRYRTFSVLLDTLLKPDLPLRHVKNTKFLFCCCTWRFSGTVGRSNVNRQ